MPRYLLTLILLLGTVAGAQAQTAAIPAEDGVVLAQIEAQLTAQGLEADLAAATDSQFALATSQLVKDSRGPDELANLMRVAVSARPQAAEAILVASTSAAVDHGFSNATIGGMIAAAVIALRAQGVAVDVQSLINAIAAATGISVFALEEAVSAALTDSGLNPFDIFGDEDNDASPS